MMLGLVSQTPAALVHQRLKCRTCRPIGFSTGITARHVQLSVSAPAAQTLATEVLVAAEESQALLPGGHLGSAYAEGAPALAASLAPEELQQEMAHPGLARHDSVLGRINQATKWLVSGFVLCVLVWRHDMLAAWCVTGAVLSTAVNKILKHLINEQRPSTARKADPGMPSSHANSLAFLGTFAAAAVLSTMSSAPLARVLASAAISTGLFLAWLRVKLGYHTSEQVMVGLAVGATSAAAWWWLGQEHVFEIVQHQWAGQMVLGGLTLLAMLGFGIKIVQDWVEDRRGRALVPKFY